MVKTIDPWDALSIFDNQTRYKIIEYLRGKDNKTAYIAEIAKDIKKDWGTVSYHLGVLGNEGIISARSKIIGPPYKSVSEITLEETVLKNNMDVIKALISEIGFKG